jgi:hypothetical protein
MSALFRLLGNVQINQGEIVSPAAQLSQLGLSASVITEGTLDPARLPPIDASKITGTLSANVTLVGNVDASLITTGTLSNARLPANLVVANTVTAQRFVGEGSGLNSSFAFTTTFV